MIGFSSLISQRIGTVNLNDGIYLNVLKAFPTARGWGMFTGVGENERSLAYVTNLNDSGVGSFREAVSTADRTVIFNVSGEIVLLSTVTVANNVQIMGQTSFLNGGFGITIRQNESFDDPLIITSGHNVFRFLRFRRGPGLALEGSGDNIQVNGAYHIFDHCSFSWGTDEQISNGSLGCSNVTI